MGTKRENGVSRSDSLKAEREMGIWMHGVYWRKRDMLLGEESEGSRMGQQVWPQPDPHGALGWEVHLRAQPGTFFSQRGPPSVTSEGQTGVMGFLTKGRFLAERVLVRCSQPPAL